MLKKFIPKRLYKKLSPAYHYGWAFVGALTNRFPSRKIFVVGVTGTKGKTTTAEVVNAILEEAGFKTALAGTLRFKIGSESKRNLYKMTMPGRTVLQRFLKRAVNSGCQYAVIEMTSEGAKQFRHKFIEMDALIFTNISPEHIESHGSFENYLKAKLGIAKELERSKKSPKIIVANTDSEHANDFLDINVEEKKTFSIKDAEPFQLKEDGVEMTIEGKNMKSHLPGKFNIYNILGAWTFAKTQGVSIESLQKALNNLKKVRGRAEKVELEGGDSSSVKQKFKAYVDYAHTSDSLEKLYKTFEDKKLICVLGNAGGGRDKWKREDMGKIADRYCQEIILTDEDPYDEDPKKIVEEMARGVTDKPLKIIMDRREAIQTALKKAHELAQGELENRVAVLITGKGTDPYIMGPSGSKTPWDDAEVVREELEKILNK